jgi:hypothetical protein
MSNARAVYALLMLMSMLPIHAPSIPHVGDQVTRLHRRRRCFEAGPFCRASLSGRDDLAGIGTGQGGHSRRTSA